MKKLLTLSLVSFLLFFGCDQETDVFSPVQSDSDSYEFIKLPPKGGLSVENTFSITKTIDGDKGGTIKIKESYTAANGEEIKIDAKIKIAKHSFTGIVDITMTIDDEIAAVSFTPAMVFSVPAKLDLKFEGIELDRLAAVNGEYEFVYITFSSIESVTYSNMRVDESRGKIWVTKADIHHFSRYGWVR